MLLGQFREADTPVLIVSSEERLDLTERIRSKYEHWYFAPVDNDGQSRSLSCNGRVILEFTCWEKGEQSESVVTCDAEGDLVAFGENFRTGWVMLDDYCLHHYGSFGRIGSEPDAVAEGTVELYDLTGRMMTSKKVKGCGHGLHRRDFIGTTRAGEPLIYDWVSYGTNTTDLAQVSVLSLPDLVGKQVSALGSSAIGLQYETKVFAGRDARFIVQVYGNVNIRKMEAPTQPHQFIMRGIDVRNGKELWRHIEPVTIQKSE